jgi:tetratricopeptide (TPR) repeat protein
LADWLKPIVLDGKEYRASQLRLHSFDLKKDPLSNYLGQFPSQNADLLIGYSDSIPAAIGQKPWKGKLNCHVVDFLNTRYCDSILFVQGMIHPLRWMQIDLTPIEITDSLLLPKNKPAWHKTSGKQSLQFKVNQPELNTSDTLSQANFLHILNQLRSLLTQNEVRIHSISIRGSASPEGSYKRNKNLAQARAQYVYQSLINDSIVEKKLKKYNKIQHQISSEVHTWKEVLELVKQNETDGFIPSNEMIKAKYLPFFRQVSYSIEFTVFRTLNKQELFEEFATHPDNLSEHDYYRLIQYSRTDSGSNHPTTRTFIRRALDQFPEHWWFRNEAFRMTWAQDSMDLAMQFISIKPLSRPNEITYNLALAYWEKNQLEQADQYLRECLKSSHQPLQQLAEKKWGQLLSLRGDYQCAWPIMSKEAGLNRILLRLALHQNELAYREMLVELKTPAPGNILKTEDPYFAGKEHYILAICAHRTNHLEEALFNLQTAIQINPKWKDIVSTDGDLMDLIPLLKTH